MERIILVPIWLERLLQTPFFKVCRVHGDGARSECNMFCLDCSNNNNIDSSAFCFYCRSSKHKDHQVIQIRRSSYHDVVRVVEIQKVLDISEVQTYVINSARVLFLNERPQPKSSSSSSSSGNKGVPHICQICGRTLLDTFRFCSLGCKLVGIKRNNGDASFALLNGEEKNNEAMLSTRRRRMIMCSSRHNHKEEEEELREGSQQEMYHHMHHPPTSSSNTRRRKGIPHRAPFGS